VFSFGIVLLELLTGTVHGEKVDGEEMDIFWHYIEDKNEVNTGTHTTYLESLMFCPCLKASYSPH